jgi:tRNA nucleotidyltransferase (CCA-adding enzyme)
MHDIAKPYCYKNYGDSRGHDDIELVKPRYFLDTPAIMKKQVLFLVSNHIKIYKTQEMKSTSIAKLLYLYKEPELLRMQLALGSYDNAGRIADPDANKDIQYDSIQAAHTDILAYSPKHWIENKETTPSGEAIKQHVHSFNHSVVNMHFRRKGTFDE